MNRSILALAALATLLLSGGCGLFGQKQLEQCRAESERLLADYRAERDARERVEVQNRALVDRVADLETRLAAIRDTADRRLAARSDSHGPPAEHAPPPTSQPAPAAAEPADPTAAEPADPPAEPRNQAAPDPWRAVPRPR